jgi:hypothetical protein
VRQKEGVAANTVEDMVRVKAETMRTTIKLWLQEEVRRQADNPMVKGWKRMDKVEEATLFERVQNPHLIPAMLMGFIILVFVMSIIA